MAHAIHQDTYDRIFDVALSLIVAAEANESDTISGPMGQTLFALLNAWEREPVHSDQFGRVIAEAENLAVAYQTFVMETMSS